MAYMIITKKGIDALIKEYGAQWLMVEHWQGSRPYQYLKHKGGNTFGRISKRVFDWYQLERIENHPRQAINCSFYNFPNTCTND